MPLLQGQYDLCPPLNVALPDPEAITGIGLTVTFPKQVPVTLIRKVCVVGLPPTTAEI
jgi:hypothetical protein